MKFGQRVRELRMASSMTQLELAERMCVSMSYISKVERGRLQSGDYPSEKFIHKLAGELKADEDELLLLADKVPSSIRQQIRRRPDLFHALAKLDDANLASLVKAAERKARR